MKTLLALVALSAATFAQERNPRYEFLLCLRRLEERWPSASIDQRTNAVEFVATAQSQLAAGEWSSCYQALDRAAVSAGFALFGASDSIAITPAMRLCDTSTAHLPLHLTRERVPDTDYNDYRFTATIKDAPSLHCLDAEIDALASLGPWQATLSLEGAAAGDLVTEFILSDGEFDLALRRVTLSIVAHRDERLYALGAHIEKLSDKAPALERETAKATLALLESLARGSTEAHEYPGARLLDEMEGVVAAAAKGERWYTPQRAGEFWLSLPIEGASVRTRVLVPSGLSKGKSAPLVVAFHGAAFDEDVWFDGYGAGAAPKLAGERGWLFAAVHSEAEESSARVEAIVAALASNYPVDAKHVFLLGHSRGARSALRAQAAKPELYGGVAAIGNALDDAAAKSLAKHPLFLAAGDHDPAREPVTAMHKVLTDAGSTSAKLTIYPNVEHWLCVQAALPDAFAWFDTLAK